MSTLYQRIAPGERPESTPIHIESRESLENEAAGLRSKEARDKSFKHHDSPAVSELTAPTIEITSSKGKVVLNKSLFAGNLLEWLIHFSAISISISICLLHFLKVYWTDEATWTTSWRWASLDLNDILKALQFAAKAHELLIVASIGAIVLHFARRRLVGRKGIALGLLMTSYGIDAPESMLSSKFWSALSFDMSNLDPAVIGLSLLLLVSAILCQLVGPASAGVIQPNLDWWQVSDPYNGQKLPLYLSARNNETFPLAINSSTWPLNTLGPDFGSPYLSSATSCLTQTSSDPGCPAFGLGTVQTWTYLNFEDHIAPNLTMIDSTGTQRALTADLIANGTAIAATQSNWVIHQYGLFAQYIKEHHPGLIDSITYPMYTSTDPIYAPLVQVQCHAVVANKSSTVSFFTDNLTNYSDSGTIRYDAQMSWPVPDKAWNFHSFSNSSINLTWVDLSQGQNGQTTNMWRPSIGAVVRVPGYVGKQLTFYTIPCIIDARWAASSISYQPTMSNIVISNLSSPASLALSPNGAVSASEAARAKAISRQQLGIGDAIQIGPEWAAALNAPGYTSRVWVNVSSIEAMLSNYIYATRDIWDVAFTVGITNYTFVNDTTQLLQAAENTTATILSLVMADGLSRYSDNVWDMLVLNTTGDGNVTWTLLDTDYYPDTSSKASLMERFTTMTVQIQRYGWGYGWSIVIVLDVIVLFIHIFMVAAYTGHHILLRFRGRWWATTAWNDAVELLILAWDSAPTEAFREAEDVKSSLWAQNIRVRERGGGDGDAMELVAGQSDTTSGGGLLEVGKKYI
ncbi:hypothetical protein HDV63DRAFT_368872 [Trichoderma sp. SZMC 28014]